MAEVKSKYNHAEAYCLMMYKCLTCGYMERIWNSRDGVTPFMVGCERCRANGVARTLSEGMMQHVAWEADMFAPDYLPEEGQRVFVTMTKEINNVFTRARVRRQWDMGEEPYRMCDTWDSQAEAVEALCRDFDEEYGEPWVIMI